MNMLYGLALRLYYAGVYLASLCGNKKAAFWINGRRGLFENLQKQLAKLDRPGPVYWFHCASLGEFEQGRPLMEAHRNAEPDALIVLTFFSPSGFEVRKNYTGADIIAYLPLDTASNARRWLDSLKPDRVYFIKYEFWFNMLKELKTRETQTFLVSAIFRPQQYFFKWYGRSAVRRLKAFSRIFVQDQNSQQLLHAVKIDSIVAGDTRFDRVSAIAKDAKRIPLFEAFAQGQKLLVAGSTWLPDEQMLAAIGSLGMKLVIVPHEIGEAHLRETEHLFASFKTARFSSLKIEDAPNYEVLIVDTIGMLSSIYRYASIAYIGGGFGAGIHNVLEAAVYGIPVIFGPRHEKFREAIQLIACGGGFSFQTKEELTAIISQLTGSTTSMQKACGASADYVQGNVGAVQIILNNLS